MSHTGTHVDAPRHFIDGAAGVETLDVEALCGPGLLVDLRDLPSRSTPPRLARIDLNGVTRILFATRNSSSGRETGSPGTSSRSRRRRRSCSSTAGVRLVGIDYLSVGSPETHRVLLGARVVIVEGLDFTGVAPGSYDVFCGPVKLEGADGAPARVLLRHRQRAEAA